MSDEREVQKITTDDVGEFPVEFKIVTAVGISVNTSLGEDANRRLEKVMSDEILKCNAEGISTEEKNSAIIRKRTQAAYQRELEAITRAGK